MKLRFLRVALYPVKCFRIVAQNLFHETRRQIFARSHLRHQMSLFRRIIVAVVGAGEQVTFTGVLDQVGNVFVGLAGDEKTAIIEKICRGLPRCFPALGVVAP